MRACSVEIAAAPCWSSQKPGSPIFASSSAARFASPSGSKVITDPVQLGPDLLQALVERGGVCHQHDGSEPCPAPGTGRVPSGYEPPVSAMSWPPGAHASARRCPRTVIAYPAIRGVLDTDLHQRVVLRFTETLMCQANLPAARRSVVEDAPRFSADEDEISCVGGIRGS